MTIYDVNKALIEKTPDVCGGKARIAGRRVRVQDVYAYHLIQGMSVNEVAEQLNLSLAQVHAALAYYYTHEDEIQADMRRDDELIAEGKRRHPSRLQAKLRKDG